MKRLSALNRPIFFTLRHYTKISQIMCFGNRVGSKGFSINCSSSWWYSGTSRNSGSQYIVPVEPYMYRCTSSGSPLGPRGVIVLSGSTLTELPVKGLKEEDELLWKIVGQLNEDHAIEVCVIKTAQERKKYADYVIVVSGASTRHLKAMTNHLYEKSKSDFNGPVAVVSGVDSPDWMIADMGSIVVHLFLPETRAKYELEKLWSLGPEQDDQYKAMVEYDHFSEVVKNVKLDDFFVKAENKDETE